MTTAQERRDPTDGNGTIAVTQKELEAAIRNERLERLARILSIASGHGVRSAPREVAIVINEWAPSMLGAFRF